MKPQLNQLDNDTRRPYDSPQLFVYGDIRQLTQAVDDKGAGDGGGRGTDKT
jgi:hypothetical protein